MRIVTIRRLSQLFFLLLLVWLVIVTTPGQGWRQLRGWPVNWLLQLDPLLAIGTALTTGAVYAGLAWAAVTIVLTFVFGRFFCGWVCPLGAINQAVGYLGRRGKPAAVQIELNRYRPAQAIKYYVLAFLLSAGAGGAIARLASLADVRGVAFYLVAGAVLAAAAGLALLRVIRNLPRALAVLAGLLLVWGGLGIFLPGSQASAFSLQSGLLDPLPLVHRSLSLVVLPIADALTGNNVSYGARFYSTAGLIGGVFLAIVLANLLIPRFFCRFVCPLGALLGLVSRLAFWRVGRTRADCSGCRLCEKNCDGACEVHTKVRTDECVLCLNCLDDCRDGLVSLRAAVPAETQQKATDISRRGVLASLAAGLALPPVLRLAGPTGPDADAGLIRPPGSQEETEFLARCTKCGQCMRVCPTNVLQPASLQAGLEGLWTPALNNRIGASGCQLNCVACSQVCPTAAIRPISLDEKLGRGSFAAKGPLRIGTAFIDRGRCLPWAMDRPCIVCQENCPVSPKAIYVREVLSPVRQEPLTFACALSRAGEERMDNNWPIELASPILKPGVFAGGDYYCLPGGAAEATSSPLLRATPPVPAPILEHTATTVTFGPGSWADWLTRLRPGDRLVVQVRLQQPYVDPQLCIGCGICEHECPVAGLRAVRVTCENESRNPWHGLVL